MVTQGIGEAAGRLEGSKWRMEGCVPNWDIQAAEMGKALII